MKVKLNIIITAAMALAITGCPKTDNANVSGTLTKQQPGRSQPAKQGQSREASLSERSTFGEPLDRATFIFTSDFEAFQRPCGCAAGQHGGLLRLATIKQTVGQALLKQDSSGLADFGVGMPTGISGEHKLWLVDCGNFADASRMMPGLRVEVHLAALAQAGAAAAVINQNELILSEAQATVGFTDAPMPLVCANVTSNIPGVEFKNFIQLANNWYLIGLAANVQGELAEGQGGWWEYNDPLQSAFDALAGIPDGANVVIAAAHQPSEVLGELQKLNVRAVVGGEAGGETEVAEGIAPRIDSPGGRGSKLQLLSFDEGLASGYEPWFVVSGEEWADDSSVVKILKQFQVELKQQLAVEMAELYGSGGFDNITWGMDDKYLPPKEEAEINFKGSHYVGINQCKDCHRDEYNVWRKSKHAFAWDSLVAVAEQDSFDCMKCHTTGIFKPGGYLPFDHKGDVATVGCESCHGMGSEHVEWAEAAGGSPDNKITRGSFDDCLVCHDSYNSPDFEAETYWDNIAH